MNTPIDLDPRHHRMPVASPGVDTLREAVRDVIGVGPDPRDPGYAQSWLAVDAAALARLLDVLHWPRVPVVGSILGREEGYPP
jgi:hypothetical protein